MTVRDGLSLRHGLIDPQSTLSLIDPIANPTKDRLGLNDSMTLELSGFDEGHHQE